MNLFVFLRKSMNVGGIETTLYKISKQFLEKNDHVLWMKLAGGTISNEYKSLYNYSNMMTVVIDPRKPGFVNGIHFNFIKYDKVIALTASMKDFAVLEAIKKKKVSGKMDTYLWIPHYHGKGVYFEEYLHGVALIILRKWLAQMYVAMDLNDSIIYGNMRHLKAFTANYGFIVSGGEASKLFDDALDETYPEFDEAACRIRSKREYFKIISVGRFSFPHKGYIIGLIKAFDKLFSEFPSIKLCIIGDGQDRAIVDDAVKECGITSRACIELIGTVAPDDLHSYFRNAHMNVGVAACVQLGAENGVLSLPARSYCEDCEVYGYLPESARLIHSTRPGTPIEAYIRDAVNMSDNDYFDLCYKSYCTFCENKTYTKRDYFLAKSNKDNNYVLPYKYRAFFINLYRLAQIFPCIKKIKTE